MYDQRPIAEESPIIYSTCFDKKLIYTTYTCTLKWNANSKYTVFKSFNRLNEDKTMNFAIYFRNPYTITILSAYLDNILFYTTFFFIYIMCVKVVKSVLISSEILSDFGKKKAKTLHLWIIWLFEYIRPVISPLMCLRKSLDRSWLYRFSTRNNT